MISLVSYKLWILVFFGVHYCPWKYDILECFINQGGGRKPWNSINFVCAHDGFSLADLVSYNQKHNLANGEDNNDGETHNNSWNCGQVTTLILFVDIWSIYILVKILLVSYNNIVYRIFFFPVLCFCVISWPWLSFSWVGLSCFINNTHTHTLDFVSHAIISFEIWGICQCHLLDCINQLGNRSAGTRNIIYD